ncbi:MAG: hypothetical protein ACE14P_05085 [Methanotrichaceae archaeon]
MDEVDFAYVFGSFLERDDLNDIDVAIYLSTWIGQKACGRCFLRLPCQR